MTEGENNFSDLFGQRNFPGLGTFHRTGYNEVDLVDYDARNGKLQGALHYKLSDKVTAIYGANYVQ